MRASTVVLGPLLARCGRARVSLPGGDDFGSRPIDMHLARPRGARRPVRLSAHGYLEAVADDGLRAADIILEFPSVGATENILMAAAHAKGTTVLDNAAREPEIADLCHFLNAMGAKIEGVGSADGWSSTVSTPGELHGQRPTASCPTGWRRPPTSPRSASPAARSSCGSARAEHMDMFLRKLAEMGSRDRSPTATGCGPQVRGPRRACAPSTWPPCPTRAWPPTTSR